MEGFTISLLSYFCLCFVFVNHNMMLTAITIKIYNYFFKMSNVEKSVTYLG